MLKAKPYSILLHHSTISEHHIYRTHISFEHNCTILQKNLNPSKRAFIKKRLEIYTGKQYWAPQVFFKSAVRKSATKF